MKSTKNHQIRGSEIQPTKETQILAKYVAMVVRNEMENFHCEHLTDAQMKILNPIIRNAICSALHAYVNYEEYENAKEFVDFYVQSIPDYWEEPTIHKSLKRFE
jgi:hypothetical protein